MAADHIRIDAATFQQVLRHAGHSLIVRTYDIDGPCAQVECEDCNEPLYAIYSREGKVD